MPCTNPTTAYRAPTGKMLFGVDSHTLKLPAVALPCNKCLTCRQNAALGWVIRCQLEAHQHPYTAWTTLTYDTKNLPDTLTWSHVQKFLKRLRRTSEKPFRFFGCGEYGEEGGRPHYHLLLFGVHPRRDAEIQERWGLGITQTVTANHATIAYTAGYAAKKYGTIFADPHTITKKDGTTYTYQPPFIQMSRGGRTAKGIGFNGHKYPHSWRNYAIVNDTKRPVPRYLKEFWKQQATPSEIEKLHQELQQTIRNTTRYEREALDKIAHARKREQATKRKIQ